MAKRMSQGDSGHKCQGVDHCAFTLVIRIACCAGLGYYRLPIVAGHVNKARRVCLMHNCIPGVNEIDFHVIMRPLVSVTTA